MHSQWRVRLSELRLGWPILIGALLGVAIGNAALPFYTAGVFVIPLEMEFGWTRTQLSAVAFAGTITIVACAPIVGAIIDRFGVRVPAAISFFFLAAAFFSVSLLQGQLALYLTIQVCAAALCLASTPLAFTRVVNEQFHHSRGMALGITLAGTGLAAAFAPPLISQVVETYGWRAGFRTLALTVVIAAPVVILLLSMRRQRPSTHLGETAIPTAPLPLREAWRNPIFLRLLLAFAILALGVCGYVMHLIPMLTDQGMSVAKAAALQGQLGFAVIVGRVAVGVLVDRYFAPRVAAIVLSFTVLGLVALAAMGPVAAAPAAFAIGFALGAEVDLIGYLTARYFGLASYGRLYGVLYGSFVLGTGLSPILVAELQARSGNYQSALWVNAGMVVVAVLLFATAPRFPSALSAAEEPAPADGLLKHSQIKGAS
jgi:MFS family permease